MDHRIVGADRIHSIGALLQPEPLDCVSVGALSLLLSTVNIPPALQLQHQIGQRRCHRQICAVSVAGVSP